MTLVGLGLYMVYIPFNAIFFDRLISTFKYASNVGFLIYIADAFGYVGSIGVLLSKEITKLGYFLFEQCNDFICCWSATYFLFAILFFEEV